jgi:hypothetical protein
VRIGRILEQGPATPNNGAQTKTRQLKKEAHVAHEPKKTVTIVVEGTPHEWPKDEISYEQVVTLEVPTYSPLSGISYAVKYTRGHGHKPEGILSPGESVKVKEGMVFSVSETGQS